MDILTRKDSVPNADDISQRHKYLSRFISTFSGIGLWVAFTFKARCVVAGLVLALIGGIIIILEAPVLYCMKISFIEKTVNFFDGKPYWLKSVFYFCLALPPIIICPGISTIGASLFILISALMYGSMALGKKARRDEMIAKFAPKMVNAMNTTTSPQNPIYPTTVTLNPK